MISSSIISNHPNEIDNYTHISDIKKGGQGSVCKFLDKSTHDILAVKKMKIEKDQKNEFELLENIFHESIMTPKKVFFMKDHFNEQFGCLVFNLMEKDLKDYLNYYRAKNENLPEAYCLILMDSMIQALFYLKDSKKIAHRDIKPQNVLIKQGLQTSPSFYLTDFGVSKYSREETITNSTIVGTPVYMAPELLKALKDDEKNAKYDSFKIDIFSLGLLFLESLTMESVKTLNENEKNLTDKINFITNPNLKEIIEKMLEFDTKKRITLENLKKEFEKKFYKEINFNVLDSFDKKYQVKLSNFSTVIDLYREIESQIKTNNNKFEFVLFYSQKKYEIKKISWKNFKEKLIAFDFPTNCTLFLGPISNENRYRILVSYYYDNVPLEEIEEKYVFFIENTRKLYVDQKISNEWPENYEICEDFTNCPCYLVPREKYTNDTDTIIIGKKEGIVNKNVFYVILDGNNMKPLQFEQKYFAKFIEEIKKTMSWSEIKEIMKKKKNPSYLFFVNSEKTQGQLYEILLETIRKQWPSIKIPDYGYINESYLVLFDPVKMKYN